MQQITAIWLQSIEALKMVPIHQLEWFIANSLEHSLEPEELLFTPGTPVDATYIVYSGRISMYVLQNGEAREFVLARPKAINGYLPFSRGKINFGYGRALEKTVLLSFPVTKGNDMICNHLELTEALVQVMTSRVRDFTTRQQQDEKMMALGKLSASLAHELNNPAAAILRDARSLKIHLTAARKSFQNIVGLRIDPEKVAFINAFIERLLNELAAPTLSLKDRTVLEDELTAWLAGQQIIPAAAIAETLAESAVCLTDLKHLVEQLPAANKRGVLNWIHNNLLIARMVSDIGSASNKIVELVGSVKIYTHMDQNRDKQYTDVHEGIRNTLVMLRHKMIQGQVKIVEDFDPALPPINAMAGELNQVWTNLIDNALDAMAEVKAGSLEIRTRRQDDFVYISFTDNGVGIPSALQEKIFEPFFTTKGLQNGTGLGLEIVQRIIQQHAGSIRLASVSGQTVFEVCLPVNG